MRKFDFYEFAGVIAPGVVVLLAAGLIWPDYLGSVQKLDVTLGGFGLALLIAYVAGHLLQGVGNLFESLWWKVMGGWPRSKMVSHHYALCPCDPSRDVRARWVLYLGQGADLADRG